LMIFNNNLMEVMMKSLRMLCVLLVVLCLTTATAWAGNYTVGLGAGMAPDYEGSDDYEGVPMLMFSGNYDSGRSFNLLGTNFRVNLLADKKFSLGPVLNYRSGRDDVDNKVVDRMDDIDDAFEAGVYALANINGWLFGVDFLTDVSDEHDGMLIQGNIGYKWQASPSLVVTPVIFSTYADDDYMDTYFGVNAGNVGTSGLPMYEADGGMKDFGARVVAHYTPWERWGVMGIMSYASLLNDAKDSPVVDDEGDKGQMFFGLMGTYRFGR